MSDARLTPAQIGEIRARADAVTRTLRNFRTDVTRDALLDDYYGEEFATLAAYAPVDIPALLAHIAALEGEIAGLREAQRWVAVGERLPEEYATVNVCLSDSRVVTIARYNSGKWCEYGGKEWKYMGEPTHWRPLPAPPEVPHE